MNNSLFASLVVLIAPLAVALDDSAGPAEIIGRAYAPGSRQLLYLESHYLTDSGDVHRVFYRKPDGDLWLEKELNYTAAGAQRPGFRQKNYLSGEEIGVEYSGKAQLTLSYRADSDDARRTKRLRVSDDLVIDTGFDHFIRAHWKRLVAGEKLSFTYLVPSRLNDYPFAVQAVACGESAPSRVCFRVGAMRWWLAILVEPIQLTYDRDSKRLLRFSGLGNVADASGHYLAVDIRYVYKQP